jgi:hypothetical protein
MEAPFGIRVLVCSLVLVGGLGLAARYWRKSTSVADSRFEELLGDRPWRRLGAGISVLISVMFVVGVWVVDIPEKPVPYAVYWIIMLGLTVWLCVLAVKDAFHTRRVYDQWRTEKYNEVETRVSQARGIPKD